MGVAGVPGTLYPHTFCMMDIQIPYGRTYLTAHLLLDNNARSGTFGTTSPLVIKGHPEVAVKSGTTNDFRDAWTIGFTPSRLAAVWVGNNDNRAMGFGTAGVTAAAPAWNRIMSHLLTDKQQEWPLKPEGVVGAHVCGLSGRLPQEGENCETRFEYFLEGTVPTGPGSQRTQVEVDKTTNQLAGKNTPPENREMQERSVLFDALGTPYCLDCLPPTEYYLVRYPISSSAFTADPNPEE